MNTHTHTRVFGSEPTAQENTSQFQCCVFQAQRSDAWTEREFYFDSDKDLSSRGVVPEHGETSRVFKVTAIYQTHAGPAEEVALH